MGKANQSEKGPIRRSSKISNALKKNFIDSILNEGMTVKKAASKFRMNYSTAKVIFRRYRAQHGIVLNGEDSDSDEEYIVQIKKPKVAQEESLNDGKRCSFKLKKQCELKSSSDSTSSSRKPNIQVISTVAWDFLNDGLPSSF